MWTMKNDHAPKNGGDDFLILKMNQFLEKVKFDHSLHFFSLHLSSSFRFLEPKISASNGG